MNGVETLTPDACRACALEEKLGGARLPGHSCGKDSKASLKGKKSRRPRA